MRGLRGSVFFERRGGMGSARSPFYHVPMTVRTRGSRRAGARPPFGGGSPSSPATSPPKMSAMEHFWLNEGFTVWAERRLLEALHGADATVLAWAIGEKALEESM